METTRYTPKEAAALPALPGVYVFYALGEEVLYVGKAKNLRKRVSDYFAAHKMHPIKTQRMVARVASIAYTAVNSEYEALLLENNLIKQLQPRYNVLLKDGKTHPYLCITQERFPRLIFTRKTTPALGTYYGPFVSSNAVKETLEVVKQLFTFRTCTYALSESNVAQKKFKVCLDYHLGKCKGPCQGLQDEASYLKEIRQIEALLKNNFALVKKLFKEEMHAAAQRLDYKQAHRLKQKLEILDNYHSKSIIVNPAVGDLDVVALISDAVHVFVGYLHVKQGAISFAQHRVLTKKIEEDETDLISLIACALRTCSNSHAPEVLTNLPIQMELGPFSITAPKIGDKRKLVELALRNALLCKKDFLGQKANAQERPCFALVSLQQDLRLKELPYRIECFDNSNIQGHHPVAAMVCFENGQPAKKAYRHYHIQTVTGADDFASMREVIARRYALAREAGSLPHLIVVDGGKGQLSAAVLALQEVGIYGKVPIVGLAKRLEEIYFPNDAMPLSLSKQSSSLRLLQRLRNEAHRFALAFHRNTRSKAALHSEWNEIPGIGPKTLAKLNARFGHLQELEKYPHDQVAAAIGKAKAELLAAYLERKKQP